MSTRFDYVGYDAISVQKQTDIKKKFLELESLVEGIKPGRAQALVMTKLEEAYAWCGKGIRDEQIALRGAALQEARGNE